MNQKKPELRPVDKMYTGAVGQAVFIDSVAVSSLLLRADRRKYVTNVWSLFLLLSGNTSNAEIMQVTVCFISLHCIRLYKDCKDRSSYLSISRYLL
jgi:hypothetical protein